PDDLQAALGKLALRNESGESNDRVEHGDRGRS
ncbi:MAG: hypothetical protein QG637_1645, partial [Chloroflexota bacterium]|nr:hypothetical protein [Chloroflexota bacterium]